MFRKKEQDQLETSITSWKDYRIGITGANGTLGLALSRELRSKGAFLIGLTHSPIQKDKSQQDGPQEWIQWECGKEESLKEKLSSLDILILNHGINPRGRQTSKDINTAIEINALSSWRLLQIFEEIAIASSSSSPRKEIWINTSEAEIQPALSPVYEISKRLIGQLVSLRWNNLGKEARENLKIRKLVLGPFRSKLNPIGIMSSELVAEKIVKLVELNSTLIIVSPNPLTYLIMPLTEAFRTIYSSLMKKLD